MEKKKRLIITIIILVAIILFYKTFGFFVIQPIGALPEGATFLYIRFGRKMRFIESPDSFAIKITGSLSLLSRGMALGTFLKGAKWKIRLPYSKTLYLISTGFKEYESSQENGL